ncbi:uncharacterized protein LOC6581573 isoform X1 [Drosophila mojavensis]|uniref:Tetraspanin n=1 Tax=Drosophila mojavensis TaxID=7230 RepID=B4KYR3_DROMO|nr:uncharacterized protein LOC6581573 isoform X1 [Drosophila mojavensis]EDW17777.2 uncharacterized protein Dmoj_GI12864 [Drosophila mojavensis]
MLAVNKSALSLGIGRPVNAPGRNWSLIGFRWLILLFIIACWISAIIDVHHCSVIVYHYSGTPDCDFVKYEACMLAGSLLVSIVLILGFILLLFQNLKTLRTYLTGLLACSWLQLMINMVLTQTYPLVHEVHAKWAKSESLTSYEIKYKCCGALGPDDYLLAYGELPRSCFTAESRTTHTLHSTGCLHVNGKGERFIHLELITPILLLVLIVMMTVFYCYLRRIKAPKRSCQELRADYVFL